MSISFYDIKHAKRRDHDDVEHHDRPFHRHPFATQPSAAEIDLHSRSHNDARVRDGVAQAADHGILGSLVLIQGLSNIENDDCHKYATAKCAAVARNMKLRIRASNTHRGQSIRLE